MKKLIFEGISVTVFMMIGYYLMFFHKRLFKKWELVLMLAGYTAMAAISYAALYVAISKL